MSILDHLAHAGHNEQVCKHLCSKPSYSDWVITTAFYSAIHYVRHLMLPVIVNGKSYSDFEHFFL